MEGLDIGSVISTVGKNYSPLSEDCMRDLEKGSVVNFFEKGTVLVKEGQFSDKTYFIIKGAARAYYLKDGRDVSDWFAFEGEFITALNSFFLDLPSAHYIEVMEDSVLLVVSRELVNTLSDKYHDFERLGKVIVTRTMLQLQQRVAAIQFETAQQKFENMLKIRPDIMQRVQLRHIASYLGITLETLSRIRSQRRRI